MGRTEHARGPHVARGPRVENHWFKGHRQRISTVGYKTIFRTINIEETFLPFTVITNKDYFQEKKLNLLNLLSRYM